MGDPYGRMPPGPPYQPGWGQPPGPPPRPDHTFRNIVIVIVVILVIVIAAILFTRYRKDFTSPIPSPSAQPSSTVTVPGAPPATSAPPPPATSAPAAPSVPPAKSASP